MAPATPPVKGPFLASPPSTTGARMSMLGVLRGPRQVLFGAGQRRALGTVTAALGTRALVCTDARFGSTPEFAELVRLLEDAGVQVTAFSEVLPDVPVHQVARCEIGRAHV